MSTYKEMSKEIDNAWDEMNEIQKLALVMQMLEGCQQFQDVVIRQDAVIKKQFDMLEEVDALLALALNKIEELTKET